MVSTGGRYVGGCVVASMRRVVGLEHLGSLVLTAQLAGQRGSVESGVQEKRGVVSTRRVVGA